MTTKFNDYLKKFSDIPTPFYFYDLDVLRSTLDKVREQSVKYNIKVHYAVKANANPRLLQIISSYGFGADCVSFNEIDMAIRCGFKPGQIVFAGVGKSDKEIEGALKAGISCFNCESLPEIEVINEIAKRTSVIATIALRINPNIEAHTHKYITTGIEESKFGVNLWELDEVITETLKLKNIRLTGIHFHVGSQITKLSVFKGLCLKLNEIKKTFETHNVKLESLNVGGGLGIDYENPDNYPDFAEYFTIYNEMAERDSKQEFHVEPGRSLVAQCGSLITKVLYIKKGVNTQFAIVDAGMTDLIRPALYQAHHKIENISSKGKISRYDVVGPICESSDVFAKYIELPETKRGDLIAIRSAGAYGEAMASRYNLRDLAKAIFSDDLK
jgi:diaminopimelate decarboxylase